MNHRLDIVVHVSNFHNYRGGLWDFIRLGTRNDLQQKLIENISLELFVAGTFFLAAIYYIILFLNFKEKRILFFFSLLCFIISIRSMSIEEMPILYFSSGQLGIYKKN